jgi:HSP20 family protein
MQTYCTYGSNAFIYPGQYVPLLNEDELREEIKCSFKCESDLPEAVITELHDSYIIELPLPGLNREDFLIQADGNILSICVYHKAGRQHLPENAEKHCFEFGLYDHHINLPEDAETAFISAEYSLGILCFHIPKIRQPLKNLQTRIVVY